MTRIEHWSNAAEQGIAAAANLLAPEDERKPYAPVPTFWSDQYDVKLQSVGFVRRAGSFEIVEEEPEERRLVVECRAGGVSVKKTVTVVEGQTTTAVIDFQGKLVAVVVGGTCPRGRGGATGEARRAGDRERSERQRVVRRLDVSGGRVARSIFAHAERAWALVRRARTLYGKLKEHGPRESLE